jgi:hypothetical protein
MNPFVAGLNQSRSIRLGAGFALALLACRPASAGCALDESMCKDRCHGPSLLGGVSGGIAGGMELGSCENSCANTYRICMKQHSDNSPAAIRRAKQADRDYADQIEKNVKQAALQQKRLAAERTQPSAGNYACCSHGTRKILT